MYGAHSVAKSAEVDLRVQQNYILCYYLRSYDYIIRLY